MADLTDKELLQLVAKTKALLEEKVMLAEQHAHLTRRMAEVEHGLSVFRNALAHGLLAEPCRASSPEAMATPQTLKNSVELVKRALTEALPNRELGSRPSARATVSTNSKTLVSEKSELDDLTTEDLSKSELLLALLHMLGARDEKFDPRDAAGLIYPDVPAHAGYKRIYALAHYLVQSGRAKRVGENIIPLGPAPKEPVRFPSGVTIKVLKGTHFA